MIVDDAIMISLCFQLKKNVFKISGEKTTLARETDSNQSINPSYKKEKEKIYVEAD